MDLVFRREQRSLMNLGTRDNPQYHLIGEGFTDFSTDLGANEDERHYIHEKTARTITSGYAKKIGFSMDMYSQNPVCQRVALAFDEEQVGNDGEVEILNIKYFKEGHLPGTYFAKRQKYSISPGTEGEGNGGNVYEHSGSFNALGDPEIGSWSGAFEDVGDGEFTPRPPLSAPDAPTAVSATPGDGQAIVTFTPPSDNGGTAITEYVATATPETGAPVSAVGPGSPITINALSNGQEYSVTVTAVNNVGTGAPSSPPATVTPTA